MAATSHAHEHLENPATAAEANVVLCFCAGVIAALGALALSLGSGGHAAADEDQGQVLHPSHETAVTAVGKRFAIATAAPEASRAAIEVFEDGGNAFDALVAASFVVSVVRPQSTGVGGGGFVVFHDARTDEEGALDGREMAPAAARPEMYQGPNGEKASKVGPLAAGVPGLVAMLEAVHRERGAKTAGRSQLTWKRLLAPAIRYARDGFVVRAPLARSIAKHEEDLAAHPQAAAIFLPGGEPPQVGDLLVQSDLAATLEAVAHSGARAFYDGSVGRAIARATERAGGLISAKDMANYTVKHREVVRGSYRGREVVSMPPPSSGGVHLIQMLNILSGYDLAKMGHHSPDHLHVLAESMRRAFADRNEYMADADFVRVPVEELTDPAYGARLRAGIDLHHATRSAELNPGALLPAEGSDTTHISIVDDQGNAVASTQTINSGLGSCFVAGDTGVLLNNEMDDFTGDPQRPNTYGLRQGEKNLPAPGKRPLSSMTPTILFNAEGKVEAVLGTPGGPKIITTTLQVLSNLVDFKMSPTQAVAAPRIHHQWLPDEVQAEHDVEHLSSLVKRGHRVKRLDAKKHICNAQIVVIDGEGKRIAASDPRETGRPGAY